MSLQSELARHARAVRRLAIAALERCGWQITAAAEDLGLPRQTLRDLIARDPALAELAAARVRRGRPRKG
jgi:transposase